MFSESLMKYLLKYQTEDFKKEEPKTRTKERFTFSEPIHAKRVPVRVNNK